MIEPIKLKELLKGYIHDLETTEATHNAKIALETANGLGEGVMGLSNRIDALTGQFDAQVKRLEELSAQYRQLQEEVTPLILKHHKKLFK